MTIGNLFYKIFRRQKKKILMMLHGKRSIYHTIGAFDNNLVPPMQVAWDIFREALGGIEKICLFPPRSRARRFIFISKAFTTEARCILMVIYLANARTDIFLFCMMLLLILSMVRIMLLLYGRINYRLRRVKIQRFRPLFPFPSPIYGALTDRICIRLKPPC